MKKIDIALHLDKKNLPVRFWLELPRRDYFPEWCVAQGSNLRSCTKVQGNVEAAFPILPSGYSSHSPIQSETWQTFP